jgi:gliding motility-associated-like protein
LKINVVNLSEIRISIVALNFCTPLFVLTYKDVYFKFSYLAAMRINLGIILFISSLISFSGIAQNTDHSQGSYKFIENGGQWPSNVHFKSNIPGGKIWLEKKGILYQLNDYSELHGHHAGQGGEVVSEPTEIPQHLVFAEFVGCNENARIEKDDRTSEYYNFYIGNDRERWADKMYGYHEVTYNELYPGIDLKFYEKDYDLKYEYLVDAGADLSLIQINYLGQDKITLNKDGNLELKTSLGKIIEQKPYCYQVKNGKIIEIESSFKLSKNELVSFELGDYDHNVDLVIDPVLIFATYAGSVTDNFGMTATYAYDGKAYSGGTIYGNAYPTPGPAYNTLSNFTQVHGPTYGITDAFISKYSADGTAMLWTTFVGGGDNNQGTETAHSLICDTSNNVYIYGATSSTDFPIQNGFQPAHGGGVAGSNYLYNGVYYTNQGTDIFIAKFSEDGTSLLGSSYVGGSANDGVNYRIGGGTYNSIASYDSLTANYGDQFRGEIMLDSMNNIYIASCTRSTNFPTASPFQAALGGEQDGVIFKVSSDFSTLMWSSYFGGTNNDACYSVKIDSSYNVLVSGGTSSSNLPNTIGGLNATYQGGKTDGFVTKITPDGSTITQTSYIGTTASDQAIFVEIDRWDNVYLVGNTNGLMPIVNAPYSNPNSGQFIMKLTPDLTTIVYSTVFGNGSGQPNISPAAFLVDVCGNVYVSGWGGNILPGGIPMNNMPVTTDAVDTIPPDGFDFYLFVMERDAESLLYGSYLGDPAAGEHVDGGTSRFDKFGVVYQSVCGGCGGQTTFPTTAGAHSEVNLNVDPDGPGPLGFNGGGCNNLIFKFDFELIPDADFELSSLEGCAPFTVVLDNESNDTINSEWTFPAGAIVISGGVNPELLFNEPGTYEITISITDTICNLVDTAKKIITVYDELTLDVPTNDTIVCFSYTDVLIANSQGTAISFTWSDDINFTNVLNAGPMDSTITINPTQTATYYVTASNGWPDCDLIDSVVVTFVDGAMELNGPDQMCLGDTLELVANNLIPSVDITYSWTPSTGILTTGDSTVLVSPPTSQYYYLTGVTNLGCTLYDSVYINVTYINPADVFATATPDTIPEGGSTVLAAFPNVSGYDYFWFPPTALSSSTGQTTTASPDEDATYGVTIFGNGCEAKTQVSVVVLEFICGDIYIFVPSGFTPNGDGENDVVYVRGDNLLEIDFKIFDRWGEMVFSTTDQAEGWDGSFKGEMLDPDVYVYHLTAICFDGQESLIKGNISLLK